MSANSSNKTIAKNTLLLYMRMMVIMVVSLYTSRVILQYLGVDDYGIYQAVGGIVGFMTFLYTALASGSSRFMTFALGKGDKELLNDTFSTVFTVHMVLAVLVVLIAETVGLWYLYNKMVIPVDRMNAAIWVFHLSILTMAINITQVPYSGVINAHEKFSIYAYISIVEAFLRLSIVFLLDIGGHDKLIMYAVLYFLVQVTIRFFYRWYCTSRFSECRLQFKFKKDLFRQIASFSGWNLFANVTIALNNQGILLLLNLFFSPAVVAARALSLQVDGAITHFVNSFKSASNPQIVKRYAAGDIKGSQMLTLQTSNLAYYLMLALVVPVCISAHPLLHLWLTEVPEYTVIFLQLIAIKSLFDTLNSCFYSAFYASGRLRENAIVSPLLNLIRFIIIYFFFRQGYSPVVLSYAGIIAIAIMALIIKPWFMVKYVNYQLADIVKFVFLPCFKVTIFAFLCAGILYYNRSRFGDSPILQFVFLFGVSFVTTSICVWFIGLSKYLRVRLTSIAKKKLLRI